MRVWVDEIFFWRELLELGFGMKGWIFITRSLEATGIVERSGEASLSCRLRRNGLSIKVLKAMLKWVWSKIHFHIYNINACLCS